MVKRMTGSLAEVLALIDPMNVTGAYLTSAKQTVDTASGTPAILFTFNKQGAMRLEKLTSANRPNPATPNLRRRLGIILDEHLLSAPFIMSTLSNRAMLSGVIW